MGVQIFVDFFEKIFNLLLKCIGAKFCQFEDKTIFHGMPRYTLCLQIHRLLRLRIFYTKRYTILDRKENHDQKWCILLELSIAEKIFMELVISFKPGVIWVLSHFPFNILRNDKKPLCWKLSRNITRTKYKVAFL